MASLMASIVTRLRGRCLKMWCIFLAYFGGARNLRSGVPRDSAALGELRGGRLTPPGDVKDGWEGYPWGGDRSRGRTGVDGSCPGEGVEGAASGLGCFTGVTLPSVAASFAGEAFMAWAFGDLVLCLRQRGIEGEGGRKLVVLNVCGPPDRGFL